MVPYIIVFFLLFFSINQRQSINNWRFYFLLGILVLFAGVRDMIGGSDVYIYAQIYESPNWVILGYEPFEFGFRFFYLFLKIFSEDREFMFFICALLIVFGHASTLKKYSPLFFFSFFLFFCKFYLMSFVYLRQGLAMAVVWAAIPFAFRQKYLKYFLLITVGVLIHKSAFVFLPFIFLARAKLSHLQMFFIALIVLIIAASPLNNLLFNLIAESTDSDKMQIYANLSSSFNFFYLTEVLILVFLLLKYKSKFDQTPETRMIANGAFAYILVTFLSLTNASFIRFSWYYLIFFILSITYFIVFEPDPQKNRLAKTLFILYFGVLFFRLLILWDGGDLMPYKTIFQDFDREGLFDDLEYR